MPQNNVKQAHRCVREQKRRQKRRQARLHLPQQVSLKKSLKTTQQTRLLRKQSLVRQHEITLVFKKQVIRVVRVVRLVNKLTATHVENYVDHIEDIDIHVIYKILGLLSPVDILAFAGASKSMFDLILLDGSILEEEFAQKLYLQRWLTILPRKIGLTIDMCRFGIYEDVSHLTLNERCVLSFNKGIYEGLSIGEHTRNLNCTEMPPFLNTCEEKFTCKLCFSHVDVCEEQYCDCGIAEGYFSLRDSLSCDCMKCRGLLKDKSEDIVCLKQTKAHGCPHCGNSFTLGDVDFQFGSVLDSTCDVCHIRHQGGITPNYRCMDCIDDTNKWINYCEKCWETCDNTTTDCGVHLAYSPDNIELVFNKPAKEEFAKQTNLMTLFQKDRQFFALNSWFMFVNELLIYIKQCVPYSALSLEDYVHLNKELLPATVVSKDTSLEEERVPQEILLWYFVRGSLESLSGN